MPSLHVIYASTSGHTEYVIDTLIAFLGEKNPSLEMEKQLAEKASTEDLLRGDVLLLASGTWNTGGQEGQLSPFMFDLLKGRARDVDLSGKLVTFIALGDKRYFYAAGAGTHLRAFIESHGGKLLSEPLMILNEPYGQERKIEAWGRKFLSALKTWDVSL